MAAPKRFFVENIAEEVKLPISESRHARNVLRLAEGDEVTLFDGSGSEYSAVVTRADKNGVSVHVVRAQTSDREPKTDVFLLVGALKGDKTELVVQKATELGANRIGVFSSRYCAAYMNENKLERLRRVAREAAKQCLRAAVPQVEYFPSLPSALAAAKEAGADLTDDGQLFERMGWPVAAVTGHYDNIKITTPEDIPMAEALLSLQPAWETDTEEEDW